MIWVLDSSVAVKWFIVEESHPAAEEVLAALIDQPGQFAVPELFAFEVFSVLHRIHPQGPMVFEEGILPLLQAGLLRMPMTGTLAARAHPFVQLGLTGYDACYAALARELDGLWLTFDQRAHKAIRKEKVSWSLEKGLPPEWVRRAIIEPIRGNLTDIGGSIAVPNGGKPIDFKKVRESAQKKLSKRR
jgi:predicted nucleic acid-binding protein